MITIEEILETARRRRVEEPETEHEHDLKETKFNIEGHRIRGKVCSVCGERFFLMDDLLLLEEILRARETEGAPLSIEDAVILLAGTYPDFEVSGKLVMQKEMFLLEKSFAPEHRINIRPMEFVPFHMGPYSKRLKQVLQDLQDAGIIETRPLAGRKGVAYKLTDRGKRLAEERKNLLQPEVWEQLRRRRRGWDELGSHGLLRLVYQDFSAYAGKSQIKEQVEEGFVHEA